MLDLLQVYFNLTNGNAKEEKLKTRRDGGKGRKEGGGENFLVFRKVPSSNYQNVPSDPLLRKIMHLKQFFANFHPNPPMFNESLR